LKELSNVFRENELEEFIKNEMESLTKMAHVYVTSRYYTREFYREEIENLFRVANKIKERGSPSISLNRLLSCLVA